MPFDTLYMLFYCNSTLFYIILNLSACPDAEKGTVGHTQILIRKGGGFMMTWSEFFGFLAILIELFKFFFRVLRFVIKMSKKKSNRSGLR